MKLALSLLVSFFLLTLTASSQVFKVTGKVVNNQLEPLAFASIEVRELRMGIVSKEDGSYELELPAGKFEVIVSMVGYMPSLFSISVDKDFEQNFILSDDTTKSLGEVIIRAKSRDRAEEVIRNVIERKNEIISAAGSYSANIYIKATQNDSVYTREKTKKDDTLFVPAPNADLEKMAMAEVLIRLDHGSPQLIKEQREGVKRRGDVGKLFYLSSTEGDFNLYNNLIRVPNVSDIPLISPISYSGLMAYRFKTLKIDRRGKHRIYTISIRPRALSNATVEGEVVISDSLNAILYAKFSLPEFHMPEYDFFEVEQHYEFVNDTAWMITRQQFNYFSKTGKGRITGETVAFYRDYELNKNFRSSHFGNAVSITAQQAYERDSLFWTKIRTEPLTGREIRFIRYSDSIHSVRTSKAYLDSLDRETNKITWKNALLLGQAFNNHEKERKWLVPPLVSIIQPIQFGGTRINLQTLYMKNFPSRKNIEVTANLSYGFRNSDFNGGVSFMRRYNPLNGGTYRFSFGRDFQFIYEGDAWINLIKRSNIYLNNAFSIGHSLGIVDGLYLTNDFDIALRRSVSDYRTNPKADSLFGDIIVNDTAIAFQSYNAVYSRINLAFTPGLKYLREPREKIALGSKWPTFYVEWRKGVPRVLDSDIDFDYLEFGIQQKIKFGVIGEGNYKVRTGKFYNKEDLRMVDYSFQRQGDPLLFSNPNKSFQALDSTFPVFNRFYEGHYVHEFNGMFLNKIPLLKRLELREVAGGGFLIAAERDLKYFEAFAGIERIIKWPFNPLTKFKLGIYVVGSVANKFNNPVQFKIGITKWDWLRNRWL